jgi:hypothetical protein
MPKERSDEYKMKPTVYGVGYLGIGEYKARKDGKGMTKEYVLWTNMLSRCYGVPYRNNPKNPPRYEDCTVCEEWHNFQNFAKWCNEQPNFGKVRYSLDKDLTEFGNTIYCPEKCYIVAPKVNSAVKMMEWKTEADLPRGVYINQGRYCSHLTGQSFYHSDVHLVRDWYVAKKKTALEKVANDHKHELSQTIYANLMNWAP